MTFRAKYCPGKNTLEMLKDNSGRRTQRRGHTTIPTNQSIRQSKRKIQTDQSDIADNR